jgi:hypothetical protein
MSKMKTSSHHCLTKDCHEYIDRETSRYLCKQHEEERRKLISDQMQSLIDSFEDKP